MQLLIAVATAIGERFTDVEWAMASDEAGWNNKQVFAHVASVGGLIPAMAGSLASAAPGVDAGAGFDVNAINAQLVAQREGASVADLVAEIQTSYGAAIDFVRGAPDDLLAKRATVGGYRDMRVSDLVMQMVVMHGIAHLYHASSRFG